MMVPQPRTINVDLADICNYILNVAANHAGRVTRSPHAMAGQSQEQVTFVLRRVVEELIHIYEVPVQRDSMTDQPSQYPPVSNETYRNRATM